MAPPRGIVLTNDDGPPSPDSPFIELFVQTAYSALGLSRAGGESDGENGGNGDAWKSTLHVAIPASQKSWIGKSYLITQEVEVAHYDHHFTLQNGSSSTQVHDRWTLLDGTPATCVNIALHNLALPPIDLVLSGPNMGRNVTNLTFASGTIGGALEGVLCGKKAIAVSFAFYKGIEYTDSQVILASQRACALIRQIWDSWTPDLGVDLWNINVPILPLDASEPAIHMTEIQRITHGGFFSPVQSYSTLDGTPSRNAYRFAPQFPFGMEEPEDGTDAWAIDRKMISVTPIRATWNVVELGRVKEGLGAIAKGWSLPPS